MDTDSARIAVLALNRKNRLKKGPLSPNRGWRQNLLIFERLEHALKVNRFRQGRERGFIQKIFFFILIELSYKSLGNNNVNGRHDQERFDLHIQEARNRARRGVGVKGR